VECNSFVVVLSVLGVKDATIPCVLTALSNFSELDLYLING